MTPIGSRHFACVNRLNKLLIQQVEDSVVVHVQNPVRLADLSEPDIALLRLREDFYAEKYPTPEDVLLLIEVADTSLKYDQEIKLPLYARTGIPEVFIVGLSGEAVERHTELVGDGYRLVRRARRRETLESVALPALALPVGAVPG